MSAEPTSDLPLEEPDAPTRETAESMRARICQAYPADRYAVLFEVRNATGFAQKRRDGYCDAMVMGLWPSRGLELWGMEIKVSRGDWLRELKRPEKCEEFFRYCHRWFVVAPVNVVKPEELPPTWGLMVPSRDGLRASVPGKQLEPQPADVGLLASIILKGGYLEWRSHHWDKQIDVAWHGPSSIVLRGADVAHRLSLGSQRKPCWSLFIVGPRVREWGFWCTHGWRRWQEFVAADDHGEVGRGCD